MSDAADSRDRADLRRVVEKITSLPTLPGVVTRITRLLDNPDTTASEVGKEISQDQVLSAKVLKLVNSGFYGFSQPISTIPHAMVLLGFGVVKTLVMSTTVLDMMAQSMAGLWQHSLACARTCGVLARHLEMDEPEEVSVTGLLHDLGKVVLEQHLPEEFAQVRQIVDDENVLFYEAEEQVLDGANHSALGAWLLDRWQLPGHIVDPIRYHHDFHPARQHLERTAVVHLADVLVRAEGYGFGGDYRIPTVSESAMETLGIKVSDLQTIMDLMAQEMKDVIR